MLWFKNAKWTLDACNFPWTSWIHLQYYHNYLIIWLWHTIFHWPKFISVVIIIHVASIPSQLRWLYFIVFNSAVILVYGKWKRNYNSKIPRGTCIHTCKHRYVSEPYSKQIIAQIQGSMLLETLHNHLRLCPQWLYVTFLRYLMKQPKALD